MYSYGSTDSVNRAFRTERATFNEKNEKVFILRRNDMVRSASADHLYSAPRATSPRVAFDDRIRANYSSGLNLSSSPISQPRSSKLSFADEMKITDNWKRTLGPGYDIIISPYTKPISDSGLGIGIERTQETEAGCALKKNHHYISSVDPSGPVGREGRINVGDELLQVNDYRVFHENTGFVSDILKDLPMNGYLACARNCPHGGEGYHYQSYHARSRQDIENEIMPSTKSVINYSRAPDVNYPTPRTYSRPIKDNDDAPYSGPYTSSSRSSVSPSRPRVQLIYDPAPGVLRSSHEVSRISTSPSNNLNSVNYSRVDSPPSRSQELYVRSRPSSPVRISESNFYTNNTSRFWDDFQEEVILVKPKEGFGMGLVEVPDKEHGTNNKFCIIDSLDPNGMVQLDRRLKLGDRIVEIDINDDKKNDYHEGKTSSKSAKELIDSVDVGQTLRLTVQEMLPHVQYSEVKDYYGIKSSGSNLNYSAPPVDKRDLVSPSSDISNFRLPEPSKVVIKKNLKESLGISLDYSDGGAYGYKINGILAGSAADRAFRSLPSWHTCPGRGDYLIDINDYDFCNLDSYTARSILSEISEKSGTFVVSFRPGNRA